MWDLRTLHSFREVKCLQDYSILYGWVYKTLRLSSLVVEHNLVVTTVGSLQNDPRLNPMGSQFFISVLLNLCS